MYRRQGLIAFLLLVFASVSVATPLADRFDSFWVLGDSLSDSGNLFTVTGGVAPDPTYYDDGRFQNGPNYADLVWQGLGFSGELMPSYQGGTNYAVGGARSRYHRNDLGPGGLPPAPSGLPPAAIANPAPFSLLHQLDQFQGTVGATDPNGLYTVFSGSNDLGDALVVAQAAGPAAAATLVAQSVGDIGYVLSELVGMGVQNLLVPNIPNIALTPEVLAQSPIAQAFATQLVQSYNSGVDAIIAGLIAATGVEVFRFDTYASLEALVENPGDYGLVNTTDACLQNFFVVPPATGTVTTCGNPDQYVFWDAIHPTAAVHTLLAGQILDGFVPLPGTLVLLVSGFMGLRSWRRSAPRADTA